MKLCKLLISTMLILLCVQCDPAERRKSKAEDVIEKHLFETLDNYQSYEKISTEVDTLQEPWILDKGIMTTGQKLLDCQNENERLNNRIIELNDIIEQYRRSVANSLLSGNGGRFWSIAAEAGSYVDELKSVNKQKEQNDSIQTILQNELDNLCLAFQTPKETYWHVTQKFRYSKDGQDSKIYTLHFVFDPDVKEILSYWEDNDPKVIQLIDLVGISFSIPGEEEFFDAVTEDEE